MTECSDLIYDDLDWNQLWKNSRRQKGWSSKGAEDWDKKAASFAARNSDSPFASLLLPHLPLDKSRSVLDIGCGPGTLSLPMAKRCRTVTAMDFSAQMLQILGDRMKAEHVENIKTVNCAWEDDWEAFGIEPHDIAIAARSMGVDDLEAAVEKLQNYSTSYVFIADRISPTPFDPGAFAAVGREFRSGPDYIYTLNMLYSMGIHPNVSVMELDRELHFSSIEDAMLSYSWMIKEITSSERRDLKHYVESKAIFQKDGSILLKRNPPPAWALIWWVKNPQ